MTKQPHFHRCTCHIIPDVVFKELEKEGYDIDASEVQMDEAMRARRSSLMTIARALPPEPGNAARKVYDCESTSRTRFKLVRKEDDSATTDVDVNDAYDNGGFVREYYKTVLGWDSIDNNGLDMIFNVHYLSKYNNAFWDGEQMTFGDGDGVNFSGFDRALDVTGHELTHGVVQYTANLVYKGQSGALNEHYADALGTAIKQWQLKQTEKTADWLMGDSCMIGKFKGKAIRSMKAPADTNVVIMAQPDNMSKFVKGTADNGGVHTNSGIPNKAFYLVSMDIGTQKAAVLWFEALKILKSTANFTAHYKALKKSVPALVKAGKIPATSAASVDTAFKAVGIIK